MYALRGRRHTCEILKAGKNVLGVRRRDREEETMLFMLDIVVVPLYRSATDFKASGFASWPYKHPGTITENVCPVLGIDSPGADAGFEVTESANCDMLAIRCRKCSVEGQCVMELSGWRSLKTQRQCLTLSNHMLSRRGRRLRLGE